MQIEVAAETERLVREEIRSGRFSTVDDLILAGVEALREREPRPETQFGNLSDLLLNSPFAGANLDLERSSELPRSTDLG